MRPVPERTAGGATQVGTGTKRVNCRRRRRRRRPTGLGPVPTVSGLRGISFVGAGTFRGRNKNTFSHRWARGGGIPPPGRPKKRSPQTNNLFTTVPPSNWLAAGGRRKNNYFCSKFPKFCRLLAAIKIFFPVLSFIPPSFPPQKSRTCSSPPLGVQKLLSLPPAEIWLIPLPDADPTPTYVVNVLLQSPFESNQPGMPSRSAH